MAQNQSRDIYLPPRESEVLALAAKGLTDRQIAAQLNISRDTVGTYWRRILIRFGAVSRTEVVAKATELALSARASASDMENARLQAEIRDRSEAEARDLAHRNMLGALQESLVAYLDGRSTPEMILGHLVQILMDETQSEVGLIADVQTCSKAAHHVRTAIGFACDPEENQLLVIPPESIALLTNLFPFDPGCSNEVIVSAGEDLLCALPIANGAIEVHSILGVPICNRSQLIGIIILANRSHGYSADIAEQVKPLTSTCAAILASMRTDALRRAAEIETEETAANLAALLDSMQQAVVFIDDKQRVRFVNSAFCESFAPELSPAELIGQGTEGIYQRFKSLWRDPETLLARAQEIIARGEPVSDDPVATADGRHFLRDFRPVRLSGRRLGHVWKFREIPA